MLQSPRLLLPSLRRFAVAAEPALAALTAAAPPTKAKRPKNKKPAAAKAPPPLIACKRPEFDLLVPAKANSKFGTIPLASKGWLHHKSKNDRFTLNATVSAEERQAALHNLPALLDAHGLRLDAQVMENLNNDLDIAALTTIQAEALPKVSAGRHVLIAAETGCGKTLAYLLPILQSVLDRKQAPNPEERRLNSPLAVIISPGRELASQIADVARRLGRGVDVRVQTLLGGNTKRLMMSPQFEDVDILVATMGALSKLVTTGIYRMEHVRHLVLDEADTLLDDTFADKLGHFLKRFPFHRQSVQQGSGHGTQLVLASATMPTNIEELLQRFIDVTTIEHVVSDQLHRLMPHVEQRFWRITKADRPLTLLQVVKPEVTKKRPVIVFSNRTAACDYVSIFLNRNGVNCVNLNGDMLMKIRIGRFQQFQEGACDVLSTTDVGSRGLDTCRARHVVNFDFPLHVSDYIHRCGRIGRIGSDARCIVTNLISSRREVDVVQRIEHAARTAAVLPNVNANIRSIINGRIVKDMADAGVQVPDEAF